mmetsp:Transcript_98056/g.247446  ORF Transcript_98056/g.247446 Transcript_98056/m.247446 type:complete len:95 (-) Transcript_98056:559-843(-)
MTGGNNQPACKAEARIRAPQIRTCEPSHSAQALLMRHHAERNMESSQTSFDRLSEELGCHNAVLMTSPPQARVRQLELVRYKLDNALWGTRRKA